MKLRHIIWILLVLSVSVFADVPKDLNYEPENEIPQIQVIGTQHPEELARVASVRKQMVAMVQYWKERGLPNPPDLESITYLAGYDGLTFAQLIQMLNPEIIDVRSDVERQFVALTGSALVHWGQNLYLRSAKTKAETDKRARKFVESLNKLFDYLCLARYGFPATNYLKNILTDRPMSQIVDRGELKFDNAFYGRLPHLDLEVLLPKASGDTPKSFFGTDFEKLVRVSAVKEMTKREPRRRIVILPRTTQGVNDPVSTLHDTGVWLHEEGHHFNSTLADGKAYDRLIEEVFADYLAAAFAGRPEVGESFVKASAEIRDRLLSRGQLNIDEFLLARALGRIAQKPALRDLSEFVSLDDLGRVYDRANPYKGGNPLRFVLWSLRSDPSVDQARFETVLIAALQAFDDQPLLMSQKTQVNVLAAAAMSIVHHLAISKSVEKKMAKDFTEFDNATRKKILAGYEHDESESREAKRISKLHRWDFGPSPRPALTADYVIPEFLRVLHRHAQSDYPEILPQLNALSTKVTASQVVVFKTKRGVETPVYFRSRVAKLNPVVHLKVQSLVNQLEDLRLGWLELNAREAPTPVQEESLEKEKSKFKSRYGAVLEGLQQFERTGKVRRLFFPHPWLTTAEYAGKAAKFCIDALTKKSGESNPE